MLKDKIVLITGASAGIGAACAKAFAAQGAKLILTARRADRLEEVAAALKKDYQSEVHLIPLDVRTPDAVLNAIKKLPIKWQAIDILVNNAGMGYGLNKVYEYDSSEWDQMIDTNVKGVLAMCHAVLPLMLERNQGHIINIGSIAGREVYPGAAIYCATKHALRAISRGLKMDVHGTPIRVSEVQPGMVETEFSVVRFRGNQQKADKVYEGMTPLTAEDIAQSVLFCAMQPKHVNISEVLVLPVDQSSSTMVSRAV